MGRDGKGFLRDNKQNRTEKREPTDKNKATHVIRKNILLSSAKKA
jgi:hypothetical protein